MYRTLVKPILDFVFALILFTILLPLFTVCSVLLAIFQEGQVFFIQQRPGYQGKPFKIVKFKTMRDKTDSEAGEEERERITTIGNIFRALSLDEIPQLINVLKGEMSFVGPRPLLMEYLPRYNQTQSRRHEVRPGITGLAQVSGRNRLSWDEKFALDVEYVDSVSLIGDLKILFLTVWKVLRRDGIGSESSAIVEYFQGNVSK